MTDDTNSGFTGGAVALSGLWTRKAIWLVPTFALLTALGAAVRFPVPGTPVPATMQTFFVLLAGGLCGSAAGALSQVLYMVLGLCGLPFFAMTAGGGAVPPTMGYIAGFVVASALMGYRIPANPGTAGLVLRGIAATLVIYVFGLSFLALYTGSDIGDALLVGVVPFLPWDAMKILAAAISIEKLARYRR